MLAFFRRALGSWVVIALLALVVLAFVVTGVGNPIGLGGGGPASDSVASVDGTQVPTSEVSQRIQSQYQQARRQQPDLTLPNFLTLSGGINAIVDQLITARLLEVWAANAGIVASDKLVDAQIADVPAFRGINGQFDERTMQGILAQQRLTLDGLRSGIRGDLLRRQIIIPISALATPAIGFATPYAGLVVAKREGAIGLVPYKPEAVAPPTAEEVAAWYKSHIGRYTLPERRSLRYAAIDINNVQAPTPSDAAVEAKYKADAAKYAASEKRTLQQVVLPDEAAAKAFAAKLAGGVAFATAASTAGFDAAGTALGTLTRQDLAAASSPAIADAAFAVAKGGTTAPTKSALGWHIVHVEAIETTPGRSLAEVRGEILGELIKQAKTEALAKLGEKLDAALSDGASFADIVKANNLTVVTTPPLLANGTAPGDPNFHPDPTLTALLKPGFLAAPEDAPTLETVGTEGQSALLSVAGVVAAAPLPLDQIRPRVAQEMVFYRAADAARKVAQTIMAQVDAGKPLATAFADAGYQPPQPIAISQIELRGGRDIPPALRALFQLSPGKSMLAPGGKGVMVVHLDRIAEPARELLPVFAGQMRGELGRAMGDEYVEQFANAARREMTVRKNAAAIQALGRQLSGQLPADGGQ